MFILMGATFEYICKECDERSQVSSPDGKAVITCQKCGEKIEFMVWASPVRRRR